ncbi:hypothetical protein PMYN1_Chma621 (chromatophore) [Paulinella micropora]|uniref:Uncharacterized protein n=1 Tax=Paulinella micropora TaxID=1928728 RepID=A0A5K7W3D8_9EUKA|nr:hypothetical protein PMYN1_Chma621 [Paulinella micropora]
MLLTGEGLTEDLRWQLAQKALNNGTILKQRKLTNDIF